MLSVVLLLPVIASLLPSPAFSQKQPSALTDNFSGYQSGSDGSPVWLPVKGSWQIRDGGYVQTAGDYDCASMLDRDISGSFELTATFEHRAGDPGAGFIFSSCRRDDISYAQMVRFDGSSVFLAGYYQAGDFNGVASVKSPQITAGTAHTLTLRVNRDLGLFSVSLDGHSLLHNVPLVYPSGYCGLESSGGEVRFTRVALTSLPTRITPSQLSWVRRFAVDQKNRIIVPDERDGRIRMFSGKGELLKEIGKPASERGQLHAPNAVALLDDSLLAVTDAGADRLHLFSLDGRWKRSSCWKGKERNQLDAPAAIAANGSGRLFVVERGNHRVQVFNDTLASIAEFGAPILREPSDVAVEDSTVAVLNTGLSQVEFFRWTGTRATWIRTVRYGGGEGRGIALRHDTLYLSVVNEVRAYDTSGTLLASFRGRSIGFILPWGLAAGPGQRVCFADYFGGRIVITTPQLLDPLPRFGFSGPEEARINWESPDAASGDAVVLRGNDTVVIAREAGPSRIHQVGIHQLRAGTTYHVRIAPTLETMPPGTALSRAFTFTTPAGPGMKEYARLPMMAIIFMNVHDGRSLRPGDPPQPPLPESEIARIDSQLADAVRFYWIHSGMRLFLDLDTIVVRDPVERSAVYGPEWWYPPRDSMIEAVLRSRGRAVSAYSGFLYLTCTQQYDTTLKKYQLAGKGGAFTNGVGTGKGYGISWWDVTRRNHNAGNNWLMVHEFNHQLDDIFMVSGYPEYWFNHISPTIGTAARFGEHFDANAYILHIVPPEEWYDLRYTIRATVRDADGDGIPDNAPGLPLDEVRLGSDSNRVDSDGDGVSDFDELFFSNWITEGWGETYGAPAIMPNLHDPDTDHDGLDDAHDPAVCFPEKPEILSGSPRTGSSESGKGWHRFASLRDPRISAEVSCAWERDSLHFAFSMDRPAPVKLMIDGNDDGWFLGRENCLVTLTPKGDSAVAGRVQVFNATDPHQWPFMDDALADSIRIHASIRKTDDNVLVEVSIPRSDYLGLTFQEHRRLGILIGFLCPFDEDGNKRYVDIFEPNRFIEVELRREGNEK